MKSIFEEMGGTYTLGEDEMYYPDLELLIQQIQEQQGVNEELKSRDQMGWVGACNNIRNAAEEIDILLKMKTITVLYLRTSDGLYLNANLMP